MTYFIEDDARLEYGRLIWNNRRGRQRLLYVWEHPDHPHREIFAEQREMVVGLLECANPVEYIKGFPDWSLRTMTRQIPAVIWSLWEESASPTLPCLSMSDPAFRAAKDLLG
jgi:hypothetical protein